MPDELDPTDPDEERFSLHPLTGEQALRRLLGAEEPEGAEDGGIEPEEPDESSEEPEDPELGI